jgi:hypothetical protein
VSPEELIFFKLGQLATGSLKAGEGVACFFVGVTALSELSELF